MNIRYAVFVKKTSGFLKNLIYIAQNSTLEFPINSCGLILKMDNLRVGLHLFTGNS